MVQYDMSFAIQDTVKDKETPEPFSLDFNIRFEYQTEELQPVQEEKTNEKENRPDIVEQSDLQEKSNTEIETQNTATIDPEPNLQDDL